MKNACLGGPGSESIGLDFLLKRNRHILVPGNLPVRARDFVEKNSPYRQQSRSQDLLNERTNLPRIGEIPDFCGHVQQISDREDPASLTHRLDFINPSNGCEETGDFPRR
jgi:hypothetical protein